MIKKFLFRKICYLFFVVLFFNFNIYTRITDKNSIAGWYDCIKDDKKYLSPFLGFIAIETDYCKKIYDFGMIKADKKILPTGEVVITRVFGGDPVAVLTHALFHKVGDNFRATLDSRYPAKYLTASDIGKILSAIENSRQGIVDNIHQEKLLDELSFIIEKAIIRGFINDNEEVFGKFRGIISDNKEVSGEFKDLHTNLKGVFLNLRDSFYSRNNDEELKKAFKIYDDKAKIKLHKYFGHDINFLDWVSLIRYAKKGSFRNVLNILPEKYRGVLSESRENIVKEPENFFIYGYDLKEVIKKGKYLSRVVLDALNDSGYFKKSDKILSKTFSKYIVHKIFLAFLYDKVEKTEQFIDCFSQFSTEILKKDYKEILEKNKFDVEVPVIDLGRELHQIYRNSVNAKEDLLNKIKEKFEQIAFSGIKENYSDMFKFPGYEIIRIKNDSYIACAENVVLNWICFLMYKIGLFDKENRLYETDPEKIRHAMEKFSHINLDKNNIKEISNFFTLYDNKNIRSGVERLEYFTKMISDLPGIKYLIKLDITKKLMTKTNDKPFVHPKGDGEFCEEFVQQVDENYYLYELAGYPSSFVKIVNYFFGFNFDNLSELCEAFKISYDKEALDYFTDENAYKSLTDNKFKIPQVNLSVKIFDKDVILRISGSTGHSTISYVNLFKIDRYCYIMQRLEKYTYIDGLYNDLISIYAKNYHMFSEDVNMKDFIPKSPKDMIFSLNLYDHVVMSLVVKYLNLSDHAFYLLDLMKNKRAETGVFFSEIIFKDHFIEMAKAEGLSDNMKKRIFKYYKSVFDSFDPVVKIKRFKDFFSKIGMNCVVQKKEVEEIFRDIPKILKNIDFSILGFEKLDFDNLDNIICNKAGENIFSNKKKELVINKIREKCK